MRTKLKLEIGDAQAMNNGICFYSKRHKNYVAIATIDKGIISTEWTTKKYKIKEKKDEIKEIVKLLLIILLLADVLLRLAKRLSDISFIYGMRTLLLLGHAMIMLGIFIIHNQIARKQKKDLFKFHSAEHMALNAYCKLNRVPTIEEIHKFSRFRNDCGTNATTGMVMSCLLMFACTFIPNILYQLRAILLGNIIIFILLTCGCLNFLQKFTTDIPSDTELLVAIEGMGIWLENEKKEKEKSKFLKFLSRLFPRVFN